jgi:DNA-binding response OmpR family regulator
MNDRPKILVVDDEQSARDTVEALLYPDRYEMHFATTGRDALARLADGSFDLVLCDLMMPGMDGFEVCRTIKAHEQWRFVPVILITALDGQDDMLRGLEAGADEFLPKPIDKVVLRARVRSMLRIRAHYDQLRESGSNLEVLLLRRREQLALEARLSDREREVLELLLLGRNHQEIGTALGIAARTAKFHQMNILEKLGADSRMDLLRLFL